MPSSNSIRAHSNNPSDTAKKSRLFNRQATQVLAGPAYGTSIRSKFDSAAKDAYRKTYDERTCEVHVESFVTLKDYERVTPEEDMTRLKEYARAMKGKKLIFINATYAGGGVAIMRGPLIHLLRSVGIDAHWYVLKPNEEAFKVTKRKFHNVLQDVAGPDVRLTEEDKRVYEPWIEENANALKEPLSTSSVIVIDDWQPSGLIPYIKGHQSHENPIYHEGFNTSAKIIFRDHIQTEGALMSTPGTPQHTTWQYIWVHNRVNEADVFVAHPVEDFIPLEVPSEKVVYMPATCDLLDDLNRPLTTSEMERGLKFVNEQLAQNEGQAPLNTKRPYFVLIARFDPSKGMPQGMEAYALARKKMEERGLRQEELPQLVIIGNGSADDPDGIPVLVDIMRRRSEDYADIKNDIKVVRVPHNDIAINAILKGSSLALQPSTKEGFESRVTDAILQGVPVLGSSRGGIPLQIIEGYSGHIIDPYLVEKWADIMADLMTDANRYQTLKQRTKAMAASMSYKFTTIPNALRWLLLTTSLIAGDDFKGNKRWVEHIAVKDK